MSIVSEVSNPVSVKFDQLVKKFSSNSGEEDVYAVKNFSLDLESGELITLLGPSGCGKTTTLRMLAGFELPTSGRIYIGEKDITDLPPNKRNVGMVFQSYALFPHLTVYENISYGLKIKGVPKTELQERVHNVLSLMHLESMKERFPSHLSGGQQQRVAIARAIVTEPKVLLFDEPLSNLDAKLREYMRDELRNLQQRLGITSLYVTHDQDEAMAISDKIVIMDKGEIQQIGSPREVYTKPINRFVADFMGKTNFLTVSVDNVTNRDVTLHLEGQTIRVNQDLDQSVREGETVDCTIRPEFWQIDDKGTFSVEITRATYLGTYVEYEATLGNESIKFFDYFHHENGMQKKGSKIRLSLKTEFIRVLPKKV